MSWLPSSTGHNVKPLDIELQNGSGIGSSLGDRSPHQRIAFSLRRFMVALILCAGFGAIGTFSSMIVGHSILQPYLSGFDVSIHSTAKVGAVGGAIVNGLLLPIMISFAASQQAVTSLICLALVTAGLPTTVASSCVGVVILCHIPGGTLDIPNAVCAAAVGYSVLTSPILLVTIYSVIQGSR
ncbi:hypothetical protein DEU56DRAFT_456967 [Suillus clintonianus]|uniref:uncharacterized protein n=1 Tax=Suillus clintonianus TaxID=1904413 RepID=UPI001B86704C|nr:uncharacterized protein DEU56DRAFT_456967 [Suillus clintonianus]KAG2131372.1 hypothetical protein DEU56DRAFT_456967 [Suillus clintonianus]